MIELAQPPLIVPAKPAIITAAEQWESSAQRAMERAGLPRHVRRAVVAELKRMFGIREKFIRPSLDDLSRYAGMNLAGLPGFPSVVAAAGMKSSAIVEYIENHSIGTDNQRTYNHTGRNIGAAASDRYVLVAASTRAFSAVGTITSLTINGVAASIVVGRTDATNRLELWGALVPSGSTGVTISVTWSNSDQSYSNIAIFKLNKLQSTTPTHTASNGGSPSTVSLNVSAGGVAVAVAMSAVSTTISFTGLTKNFDNASLESLGGASGAFSSAQTGLSVSASYSGGSPVNPQIVAASFR